MLVCSSANLRIFLMPIPKYSAASFGEFDLLLYMFPALLKKAFAQGLVKKYKTFKNNDANIKGAVDVTRHIQNNIPFNGRVAYNNRNYTTDNSMTELIRHTIELIKTKPNGNFVLTSDYEMIECVRTIQENTPSYSKNLATTGKFNPLPDRSSTSYTAPLPPFPIDLFFL